MRRWALFSRLFVLIIALPTFAQVQTVGDVSFAVPEGWTYQGSTDGGLMLLKQGTNFWIITVHAQRPATGNQNTDFKSAWQTVVSSQPQFSKSLPGYDPYTIGNKMLGYPGKYYDSTSDDGQMYIRLYTLQTGKTVVPVMVLSPNRQVLDFMEHIISAVVGSVRVAPLKASPIRTNLTMADLAGDWKSGMAMSQSYYDRYNGSYVGSTTTAYGAGHHITSNGNFTYKMTGLMSSRPVADEDSGTVELGGQYVTFKGRARTSRYRFLDLQTAIDGSLVLTLLPDYADKPDVNIVTSQEQWEKEKPATR